MKKNKLFVIVSAIILVVALVGLIIGYYIAGTNFLEYLGSKWAMYIYTCVAIWLVVAIGILIKDKVRKLWKK